MKYLFTLTIINSFAVSVIAQSLTPTVIASAGAFAQNANGSLSYTVGEMTMVETFSANGNILTQGFQQPNQIIIGLLDITRDAFGSFVVYPNPAVDNLYFGFEFPEAGNVKVALYNTLGQKLSDVFAADYGTGKTVEVFQVSNLAAGTYYLSLNFTSAVTGKEYVSTKSFQVIN
ncbi:MAG: T9SS type A sorting domain-containing protein [Chitinophagales bacterium]|nr:T9SS type A sorting domain-containing protein [Chitinophagales bacterium]MDW8419500.1 T9SS type A sorting domain-containing protein [Chitinophagales bacterium]